VTVAIVVGVVAIIALLVLVLLYSPVLEVADGLFRLGRARIVVEMLGTPTVLRGEEWARTIGQDFEPLAHHCGRGRPRRALRVEGIAPEERTTARVASPGRADDLALALRTAQTMRGTAGG